MYWYNGELIPDNRINLEIHDAGLLYGATAFTTARVYGGSIDHPLTAWQDHLDRLRFSIESFGWESPDWDRVRRGAETIAGTFPVSRIAMFPDGREWIVGRSLPADLEPRQREGIIARVMDNSLYTRSLAEHKTGNYLGAWLASREAIARGAKEAILVDASGNWLETATGNLWGWRDGLWYTPALQTGILGGIARARLLERLGNRARENAWTAEFIAGLEGLAYSNCVVEVIPIASVSIGSSSIGFERSLEVTRELQKYFESL
jgi:4-amino-4-deoxychorismate lyase